MKSSARLLILLLFAISMIRCDEEEVTSREYPRVNTLQATNITQEGATFHAEIIFRGDFEVLDYGFVWSRSRNPVLKNSDKVSVAENLTADVFSFAVTSALQTNSTYFVRAFVQTEEYTVYGQDIEFFSLGSNAPKIIEVAPQNVFYRDTISIIGENFSFVPINNLVSLGGLSSKVIFSSDSLIKAVVGDAIQENKFLLRVSVAGNVAVYSDSLRFIPPNITGFSKFDVVYGDTIGILGDHFGYFSALNILKVNGLQIDAIETDSTEIKFVVPVVSEPIQISITNSVDQEALSTQLNILEPVIMELSPAEGFYGDEIILKGENFSHIQSIAKVFFNEAEATISSFSNTLVAVTMPSGVENPIRIKAMINEFETSTNDFYYLGPELGSFEPSSGTWRDVVTLNGNNFSPTAGENIVQVNGMDCEVISSTNEKIVVRIPDEVATKTFNFDVEVNGVQTTSSEAFELRGHSIALISPSVVKNVGEEIIISGNNFHPVSQNNTVELNGKSLEVQSANTSELVVRIPESILENSFLTVFLDDLTISTTIGSLSTTAFSFDYKTAWTTGTNFNFNELVVDATFTIDQHGYAILRDRRLYEYDFIDNTWTQRRSFPGDGGTNGRRFRGSAFSLNGKGYYGLGLVKCINSSNPNIVCSTPKSDLWQYVPESDSWIRLNDTPLVAHDNSPQVVNGTAYMMSIRGDNRATFRYNSPSDTWTEVATLTELTTVKSWTLRSFSFNGELFCLYENFDQEFEFHKYDETGDTWNLVHSERIFNYIEDVKVIDNKIYLTDLSFENNTATGTLFQSGIDNFAFEEIEIPSDFITYIPFVFNNQLYLDGNSASDLLYKLDLDF